MSWKCVFDQVIFSQISARLPFQRSGASPQLYSTKNMLQHRASTRATLSSRMKLRIPDKQSNRRFGPYGVNATGRGCLSSTLHVLQKSERYADEQELKTEVMAYSTFDRNGRLLGFRFRVEHCYITSDFKSIVATPSKHTHGRLHKSEESRLKFNGTTGNGNTPRLLTPALAICARSSCRPSTNLPAKLSFPDPLLSNVHLTTSFDHCITIKSIVPLVRKDRCSATAADHTVYLTI